MNKIQRLSVTLMMMLMATATWAYTVTWTNSSGNPAISAKYGSTTIVSGTTNVIAGQTVTLTVAKDDNKYLTGLTVQSDVPAGGASAPRRTSPSIAIEGDVEVRQTGEFTYEFTMPIGNVTITPTFANRKDISSGDYVATINLVESSHVYDWLAHTPVINNVTISSGTVTLTEGTDYTVSGIASITNVGSETITVTGIGKYKGTATKTYSITARSISGDDGAKIQLSQTSYVYNHTVQKPDITGVFMKGQTLYLDTDYENVTYSNESSQDKGSYTVTITGKGNFSGNVSATYTITQMPISQCTFTGTTSFPYNGNVWAPSITVNDGKANLTKDTHYTVTYSKHEDEHPENNASKDVGTYTMTFTAKNGTNYSGSKEITYSITSAGFDITAIGNQTYTGAAITPTVTVKDGTHVLTLHTHYEVVYSNNINVGTARVSVVGINSYNGKFGEVTFNITPKSVNAKTGDNDDITITLSETSFTYNASTQKPTVTVKDRGTLLVENRDYTLVNAGGVNVGSTYKATITGLGNYDDDTTKDSDPYSITALTYSNTNTAITLNTTNYVYDGKVKEPTVQQVKVDGIVIPSTDYTVSYDTDHTSAGSKTVTINHSSNNNLSGTATKTYTIDPKPVSDLTITLSATSFTYNGAVQYPTVTVKDGGILVSGNPKTLSAGMDYTLKYDGADAAASSAVGSYTVTITGAGNYTGSINKTYAINYGSSDSDFIVTVSGTYTYKGSAYTPEGSNVDVTDDAQSVIVKKKMGTTPETYTILAPGTDYSLSYHDNINAGTATVTATGTGNYQFVQTGTFTIQPKALATNMVSFTPETFIYNGSVQKPGVTIKDGTTKTLVEGTDYTLTNEGATNVGTNYTVTVVGKGNYQGTLDSDTEGMPTYSITPLSFDNNNTTILLATNSYVYDGTAKTPGITQVQVGNVIVPPGDYTPVYSNNENAGTATVQINASGTGNLVAHTTNPPATTNFTINPFALTASMVSLEYTSVVYSGTAKTPSVTVNIGTSETPHNLTQDTHFTVDYSDNTNVGVATVKVTGIVNYSGEITKTFQIVEAGSLVVTVNDGQGPFIYNGAEHKPNITVKQGGTTLTVETEYSVVYTNNINAGQATITVTGKGNYSGTASTTFDIDPRPLTTAGITATLSQYEFTFNGTTQKPNVNVTDGTKTLVLNTDYTLTNEGGLHANTTANPNYSVTITGMGNYSGSLTRTYIINTLNLSGAVITLATTNYVYDGTAKTPTVTEVKVGSLLVPSTDYTYADGYTNNTNAGTATVTVTAKANTDFTGTASTNFTIDRKPVASNMISFSNDDFDNNNNCFIYNASAHVPVVVVKDGETVLSNTGDKDYKILSNAGGTNVGTYEVQIEGKGNYTSTAIKTYSIVANEASGFSIQDIPNQTYDGTAKEPVPVVKKGEDILSTDYYSVSYQNNINVSSTAYVTVTGKNGYDFTLSKAFTITARALTNSEITTSLTPSSFTYDGTPKKPTTVIVHDALATINKDLKLGEDYTLEYKNTETTDVDNLTSQGTKKVVITGIGNYTGTLSPTYTINQLDISTASITLFSLPSYVYDGSNKEPGVQLVKVGNFVVPMEAYDVSYTNHKDASTATNKARVTVTAKDGSNFTGSAYTEFTILQKEVNSNMMTLGGDGFNTTTNSFTYDGAAHVPTVAVSDKVGGVEIITTDDYTLTNAGGTNVGNYEVKIDGKGNYTGSAVKQYSIVTKGATGFTVGAIASQNYTGMALTPKPTVTATVNGVVTTLTENTHYTLAWANNVNAGTNTASVTVTGIGDYSGTQTVYFTINPKALAMTMVTLSATSFTYNGNEQKPTVTVKDGGTTLSVDKDYTVTWPADMVSQGTKTITITGIGNYSGTLEPTYSVGLKSVAGAEVALSYESIVFNGSVQKPTVTSVVVDGHKLTAGTDYTTEFTATADYTNQGGKSFKIKGTGNYAGEKELSYTIEQKAVTSSMIVLANENLVYTGLDQHPTVTIQDMVGTTNIITTNDYTLLNPDHATVGTYVVTLTGKGNYKGTAEKQYSIIGNQAAGFTVAAIAAQEYTGAEIKPEPSVTDNNNRALTKGTDYTVEYSNNINAGTATVTVTGINGYSGTKSVNFEITPKSLNHADIGVTLSPATFTYTGTTQKPTVTVKDGASKTLVLNTDYTLVNDGGVAQGDYTVTVTGIGNYKDVRTSGTSYSIGGQSLTGASMVLYSLSDYTYDGNEKKPGVSEVKLGSTVIPADNYTVSYSNNVNVGEATVTVTGKGNCSGTASTTFTITPKTVNSDMIAISETTFNYDGTLHKPATVTVKNGTLPMTLDTDYTLTNEGGTAIGTYSVTITGQGNYTGTASKSYSIVANDASAFTIDAIADQTYDGTAQTPAPVVKDGTNTLDGSYYSVAYLNNINAGTAVVTVTGKNGYTFVKSQTFTIKPKALTAAMVGLSGTDFTYNGNVQKPTITVTDNNIITSNDYVVTNEGGTNIGTYHVVVNGQNNYTGSIDKTFTISQLSLSTATITLATLTSYVYDGAAKTPAVQLVKVGELVVPATAYDVAYTSNTNVGTATVTVTAKTGSNFKDGNTTTFNIEQKAVTSDMIYLSSENLEYTGSLLAPTVTVKDGAKVLALTTDYTLSNPGGTAVGTYEVNITGQGNYKGSAKKQYSIIAQGATGFLVEELTGTFTYSGSPLTPAVTVKKAGTTTVLTLNTDYTVAYTDNTNVGTATVTVTGKGNYSGTQTKNFTITAKTLANGMVALSSTAFTYSGSEQKPAVTVTDTDTNTPLTLNADYQVIYPTDAISQGTKTVTVKGIGNYTGEVAKTYTIGLLSLNDASVTLNELTSYIYDGTEKKPTVREVTVGTMVVPTTGYTVTYPDDVINQGLKTITITGTGNFTGSTTKSYTVTPKLVSNDMIIFDNVNLIHTGSVIKPVVTIKDGSKTLTEGVDYTLVNDGATEVGTYYVYVTGKGNYTGNASRSYNIITQGASVFGVSNISPVIYNGKEQEPEVTVIDNSTAETITLTKGLHYTVSYNNNKNAGTATVVVTGIGGYAGTITRNFTIKPKQLTSSMVTLSPITDMTNNAVHFTYNGLVQQPTVNVKDIPEGETTSILMDNDYATSNSGAINAGTHSVVVTGRGNYEGKVTLNYYIDALSIADADITLYQQASNAYNGKEQKPGVREVVVGSGSSTLAVPTSGYSITGYANNINVGTATVTITGQGNFTGTATTTFEIAKKPLTAEMVTLDAETFVYTGSNIKPVVTVSDGEGANNIIKTTDYTITNEGGSQVGDYTVTVSSTNTGNYSGSITRKFSIVNKEAATFDITLGTTSFVYDGIAKTPSVNVTDGDALLTENDYTVSYADNVNVGTATVTVTGKGNYAGTKTATFQITPKPMTSEMVTLSATSFVYNAILQKPTVSVSDGTILTANDYTITNNGGTHVGTFQIVVDGKGNYSGQVSKSFDITQLSIAEATVTLNELQSYIYDGKSKRPTVRELIASGIIVPTTGYTVSYGDNTNVGSATVTVTGQGDFKDSKTVTFDVVQKSVEKSMIVLSNEEYIYTGTQQKPEVTVRDGETTLTLDKDYTLTNNGGTSVGTYNVTITGKGNYKGTATTTFTIRTKEADVFDVRLDAERVTYNGSEQQPSVTVMDGQTVLTAGVHYTVDYTNNVNVGTATVTVKGQGQYEGTKSKTFLITPKALTGDMIQLSADAFTYNALLQRPEVTVADGTALTINDYFIVNEGGMNVGSYNVTVTGRNNYSGTITKTFRIGELSLSGATVVLYQLPSYIYDGKEKAPSVREVLVGNIVVPSTNYTTSITANVNVGTVTVMVTGQGNYTGSASTMFDIKAKPVTSAMMKLTPEVFFYNGTNQKPAVEVKDGELAMVAGTDYTLENGGGTEAGLYNVTLHGIGNYTGEATRSYTILSSGVNTFIVTLAETSVVYNGQEQKPAVTVMKDERKLVEGTDYTISYANNINAGTATVVVTGLGDYEGSQMKTFTITPKELTNEMVALDSTTFYYNGKLHLPIVTVRDGNILTENDYSITNDGGTEEGSYQVVVTGRNNYQGTITKNYTIVRSDITVEVVITDDDNKQTSATVTTTQMGEGSNEIEISGINIPESEQSKSLSVTIPATCSVNGKTYTVVGIASDAFANAENLKDIYLPDTEEPIAIGENAIPATTNVHTTLALLAHYALMPTLEENFRAGKVMTTVKAKNRYWTFSSGVDVCVPNNVSVYTVHERSKSSVSIVELTDNELSVGGQRIIKANNGVLINSDGNDTPYDMVASAVRMTSGTSISTEDNKDYGSQNCLVPVIVDTHFESGDYYFMKNNEFYRIQSESEDIKVPAGKAVLYLRSTSANRAYASRLDIINGATGISISGYADINNDSDTWYDLNGRQIEGRPTEKGVYIQNKKKIVIK